MKQTDEERWDVRHAAQRGQPPGAPDTDVTAAIEALRPEPRTALDLAAGGGRHSLWLAERGIETEAWDVSSVALSLISERAQHRKLAITTRQVDLTAAWPRTELKDLVVVVDYLDRDAFTQLHTLTRAGGVVVACTFTDDAQGDHPSARFRWRAGELRALPGLRTELVLETHGRVLIVARKA